MMDLVALDLDLDSVLCSWCWGDGGTGLDFLLESVGHTLWVQTIQLKVLDNCHLRGLTEIGNITAEGLTVTAKAALRIWASHLLTPPHFSCLFLPSCLMISVLCWCRWAQCFLSSPRVLVQKMSPGVRAAFVQGTWTMQRICVTLDIERTSTCSTHLRCEISSCSHLCPGNYRSGSSHHGALSCRQ